MRKETIQKWLIQKSRAWISFVQVASHLQSSNHEAPKPHRLRTGGKACYQKREWELGRQNCGCPEGSLAYKWQSLDLRQGRFNQQSSSPALSPLPLLFKHSDYLMDVHGAEFRRYKVMQWKVSLLILSSCHSISSLTEPTWTPLQAQSPRFQASAQVISCRWQDAVLSVLPCAFSTSIVLGIFGSLTLMISITQPQWHLHTPLSYFSTLEFVLFSFFPSPSSFLPSFYFISSFLSPSVRLEIDEVIIGVETDFWKNGLHEIFDPTKWSFWGRSSAKYFRKLKLCPISFHSHSHWLG